MKHSLGKAIASFVEMLRRSARPASRCELGELVAAVLVERTATVPSMILQRSQGPGRLDNINE